MEPVTISQLTDRLRKLPPDKLAVVYDFVSYLIEREDQQAVSETRATMFASEALLRRDWERPEEDAAWAGL